MRTTGGQHRYHEGERSVQARARVRRMADRIAGSIHPVIPDRAREFLAGLRMLAIGAIDDAGCPWASVLAGPTGFVTAPHPGVLRMEASVHDDDPVRSGLRPGAPLGTLGIHFGTRRRVRVNGTIRTNSAEILTLEVHEAYANCPKYIQRRTDPIESAPPTEREPAWRGVRLTREQIALIENADTFFIGTVAPDAGADASHRGGNPGFVRATSGEVIWPDYAGNSMFNTLGNIQAHHRAGLAFVDFASGTTLQVTGKAAIDWDPEHVARFSGAERLVRLEIERVVRIPRRLPAPLDLLDYSPFNPTI